MRTNDWVGKRKAARQPVNMRGEIRFLDGRPSVDCCITDISSTGCAIELTEEIDNLDDFDLFIEARSETKICKVRRGGGLRLGIAFLKSRLDDPLVIQTLLERVLRLERGYATLKGATPPSGQQTGERREATEPRRAEDRELAFSGPSVDQRIQSIASGLAELRGVVDDISARPQSGSPIDLAPKVDSHAAEISAMKEKMSELAKTLRGVSIVDSASASHDVANAVDHTDDITTLKNEMASLSAAMREIAAQPALRSQARAATAPTSADDANMRELSKLRADVSELRASVQAIQNNLANMPAPAKIDDSEQVETREQLAELRERINQALDHAPDERMSDIPAVIESLRTEMRALQTQLTTLEAAPIREAVAQHAGEPDESIKSELAALQGAVKTLIVMVSRTLNHRDRAA